MGIIYSAKNKTNRKEYIGQTIGSLKDRKKQHERDSIKGSLFPVHCALRKHRMENLEIAQLN